MFTDFKLSHNVDVNAFKVTNSNSIMSNRNNVYSYNVILIQKILVEGLQTIMPLQAHELNNLLGTTDKLVNRQI